MNITIDSSLLEDTLLAICVTRDYVGEESLPAITGWCWYDAGKSIAKVLPSSEATMQFVLRTGYCPQCESPTGIKIPRTLNAYCEDCGWPDTDFGEE